MVSLSSGWVGAALIVVLGGFIAFILVRYPDFRRAFVAHWRPAAVAERMNEFAERLRRR